MDTASAPGYAPMGNTPAGRVKILLGKIDSVRRRRKRGFNRALRGGIFDRRGKNNGFWGNGKMPLFACPHTDRGY